MATAEEVAQALVNAGYLTYDNLEAAAVTNAARSLIRLPVWCVQKRR
jgi:hypothetical protein